MNATSTRPLRLALIGPPRWVDTEGREQELSATKLNSLLIYLACQGSGVSRGELAELFWSDSANPLHSVRQALSELRELFGDDFAPSGGYVSIPDGALVLDVQKLEELSTINDRAELEALIRGPFCAGLAFDYSQELRSWFEARERRVLEQVGASVRRIGLELLSAGRGAETQRLIDTGARIGLSAAALRQAVGLDSTVQTIRGEAAREGLGAIFALGAVSDGVQLAFVLGSDAELSQIQARASGEERANVVGVEGSRELGAGAIIGRLLDELAQQPGGAGQHPETERYRQQLQAEGERRGSGFRIADAGRALQDALLAVLDEGPLVLMLPLHRLPVPVVEVVAFALHDSDISGLTVLAHAADLRGLAGPGAYALAAGRDQFLQFVLAPELDPAQQESSESWLDLGLDWVEGNGRRRPRLLWVGTVAAAVAGGWWLSCEPAPTVAPWPEHDFIVCTGTDGDSYAFELHDAAARSFTTVSDPEMPSCMASGVGLPNGAGFVSIIRQPVANERQAAMVFDGLVGALVRVTPSADRSRRWRIEPLLSVDDYSAVRIAEPSVGGVMDQFAVQVKDPSGAYGTLVFDLDEVARGGDVVPRKVPNAGLLLDEVAIARDGRRLIWRAPDQPRLEVWVSPTLDSVPRRLIAGSTDWRVVDWIADTLWVERGRVGEAEDGSLEVGYVLESAPTEFMAITSNDWNDLGLQMSPDASRVCWFSERQGHYQGNVEWLDRATGQQAELDWPGRQGVCEWTPDGRGFFFRESVLLAEGAGSRTRLMYYEPGYDLPRVVRDVPGASTFLVDFIDR